MVGLTLPLRVSKMGKHPAEEHPILAERQSQAKFELRGGLLLPVYDSRAFLRLLCKTISRLPERETEVLTAS